MSNRKRRGCLLFPLALVFLGIMLLLINLGVVDSTVWSTVVQYWPVLLILVGIDMLLQRPSVGFVIGTVIGIVVVVTAVMVLFLMPASWNMQRRMITHRFDRATAADIILSCRTCSMRVGPLTGIQDSANLISGTLTLRRDQTLTESLRRIGDRIRLRLESDYRLPFQLPAEHDARIWNLGISREIPISLLIETMGGASLDLTDIILESADISIGDAPSTITLPSTSAAVYLSGRQIVVNVPDDVGITIHGWEAIELSVPTDYVRHENIIRSANHETADHQIDIFLRPGTESIEVRPIDGVSSPQS